MPCESHSNCPITKAQRDFRARIAAEIERADAFLSEHRSTDEEKAELAGVTLGAFAGGRIDASRFQSLLAAGSRTDPATLERVDEAAQMLRELTERVDAMTKIACPPGGCLRNVVADALMEIGRVFGAARVIELARTERFLESEHGRFLRGLPFAQWSRAERSVVPWIRVLLRGADVHAAGLAEFLDGGLHVLLKIEGDCAPAPLARLASPGVYVAQVPGRAELQGWESFDGPAVAAFVPEGCARFTHDPRRGATPWERFELGEMPRAPRRAVGSLSAAQMGEDLALLETLARTPTLKGSNGDDAATPADPADQLASWLLDQAGLLA
jgi:hypothetical protein